MGRASSFRALGMGAALIILISEQAALPQETSRVRSEDPALSALIRRGTEGSPTFRRLAETIQATDGLVYIVRGRCGHRVRACLVLWMGFAGPYRVLRVNVAGGKSNIETMASIAHELTHALEVLSEPGVRSGFGMYQLFGRNHAWRSETFETAAAIGAGNAVYEELNHSQN